MKDLMQVVYEKMTLKKDFEKTFNTPEGKAVIQYLMKISGIPKKSASIDPNELLMQEGKQFIVYTIFGILKSDPEELQKQIEQQYDED